MPLMFFNKKRSEECQVHGASSNAANKTLLFMILASLALIIWHVWVYGPSGHLAKSDSLPRSFPLLVGSEIWDLIFDKHGVLAELWDVFPYFIVGILLAGYLRTYKVAVKLQASLKRYGVISVFIASFVGIITPLCACGTLTTAVSLLFAGLPLAPVMSLLVTSPLMSPSTYLLTLNDLGPEWTVIRTVAALFMGIFAGLVTHFLRKRGFQTDSIFIEGAITRGDFHDEDYPDERLRCNCKEKFGNRVAVRTNNKFLIFLAKSSEMLWLVGKYIVVGVVIGAIVERYMPYEWIYRFFGQKDPLNIMWVTLGSVPIFLHQISASSIIYHIKSSLNGTLDGGAGLAFMIGGPVTAIPTMMLFWTIFKKRVFFLYMFVCLAGTMLIAYSFQFLVFVPGVDTGNPLLKGVRSISGGKSSVIQKQNQNVRIVMDPAGKSIIATYTNDLERQGGIVFDSGNDRFLDPSKYDNRKYISNIAEWLEQNNNSPATGSVLIYDTFRDGGLDKKSFDKYISADLAQKGIKFRITDRRETPEISGRLLGDHSQLWIFLGESAARRPLTDVELNTISRFTGDGKSMLIVAGKHQPGADDALAVNKLSSRYGVLFSGYAEHQAELPATLASHFFNRASEILGRILKLVHKA
ncbi:MAG: hypothetical protein FD174_3341 [Geobacteraceae bacterium]|nr:MAG: hypothetical protein FD174_3341 [Geobacteraceae bacterium]